MRDEVRKRFLGFLGEILKDEYEVEDLAEVTSFYEDSYDIGYCDTCSYTRHEIVVTYVTTDGETKTETISGSMSDLLS